MVTLVNCEFVFATAADSEGAIIVQYHNPGRMLLGGPSSIIAAVNFIFSPEENIRKMLQGGPGLIIASVNFAFTTRVRNNNNNIKAGHGITTTPQHAMEVNNEQSQNNASRSITVTLPRYVVCDCPALRRHANILRLQVAAAQTASVAS